MPCCGITRKRFDPQQNEEKTGTQTQTQLKKTSKKILDIYNVETKLNRAMFGMLPPILEKLFGEHYKKKLIEKQHKRIKPNTNVFLRYGVEATKKQQFLTIFAEIYSATHNLKREEIKTVAEMRQILKKELTIDIFVRLFNGTLVKTFSNKNPNKIVNIHTYRTSKIYKMIKVKDPKEKQLLVRIIRAFENYMDYIMDDSIEIDHTYLWDLITVKTSILNNLIFNLVIIDISQRDITQDVEFICPNNSSSPFYKQEYPTIFVIKRDNIYELIYNVIQGINTFKITRWFGMDDTHIDISILLRAINKNQKCKSPVTSSRTTFQPPPLAAFLIDKINKNGDYKILNHVLHYNGKLIAFIVQRKTTASPKPKSFYLPCFPTSIQDFENATPTIFLDEVAWISFNELVTEYQLLEKLLPDIQLKLKFRVLDDGLVVGVLTNTDQFIQLSKPIQQEDSNSTPPLAILKNRGNDIEADLEFNDYTNSSPTEYTDREKLVKFIYLETKFYAVFRNIVKGVLNNYDNRKLLMKIFKLVVDETKGSTTYVDKYDKIRALLVKMKLPIKFANIEEEILLDIDIDEPVLGIIEETEMANRTDNIEMIFPKYNLVSVLDNGQLYFDRITDEIIRFPEIRRFLLNEETIMFDTIDDEYRIINKNEFILLEDDKNQYFADLSENRPFGNKYNRQNITQEYAKKRMHNR
jgi:hypothetical protein